MASHGEEVVNEVKGESGPNAPDPDPTFSVELGKQGLALSISEFKIDTEKLIDSVDKEYYASALGSCKVIEGVLRHLQLVLKDLADNQEHQRQLEETRREARFREIKASMSKEDWDIIVAGCQPQC
jgi:hypothetical protein